MTTLAPAAVPLLEMADIRKNYAGVPALRSGRIELRAGEAHALIGENGAGKSTLIKILAGIVKSDGGTIRIAGQPVQIQNPLHAQRLGVAVIFQELSQAPTLSVAENVFLGQEPRGRLGMLDRAAMFAAAGEILCRYRIELEPKAILSTLSPAQRQLAEIVKAIARRPKILVMDEPTSSLTEGEARIVFEIVRDFKQAGAGVIYVSHRMDEIFKLADRVTVLRDGEFIAECPIGETDLPKLVTLMVGREIEIYQTHKDEAAIPAAAGVRMSVAHLTRPGAFRDISFDLHAGEIMGIAGLVGSGRSELAETLFGLAPAAGGEIRIDGAPVRIASVRDALAHGIALVPESRHTQGLVLKHTIEQNMTLPLLRRFVRRGLIGPARRRRFVRENIGALEIKSTGPDQIAGSLSGGNQQKVVLAKWLATGPRVLIVDEPTAGIDVHSKSEIHRLLRGLARGGVSIVMISSEMPELLAHSDRIMVMNRGRALGVFDAIDQEGIMSLIMNDIIAQNRPQESAA